MAKKAPDDGLTKHQRYGRSAKGQARNRRYDNKHPERKVRWARNQLRSDRFRGETVAARVDPIRDFVTEWIANRMEGMQADAPAGVQSIEVHKVGPRETVLRVRTDQGMPRYFAVKVSEPQ